VARIYKRQAQERSRQDQSLYKDLRGAMLIRRPPSAVFDMFRRHMLTAFRQWVIDSKPTADEIDTEIAATLSAMRQMAEV
jgi:hypothetical protein